MKRCFDGKFLPLFFTLTLVSTWLFNFLDKSDHTNFPFRRRYKGGVITVYYPAMGYSCVCYNDTLASSVVKPRNAIRQWTRCVNK